MTWLQALANFALYVNLKVKPEKRADLETFLKSAFSPAKQEAQTITSRAFAEDESSFGIFHAFETDAGRQAHLDGSIAKAKELLAEPPRIHKITL